MTKLTVDIDNSKSQELLLNLVNALGLSYEMDVTTDVEKPLNKAELAMYKPLKKSIQQINLHGEGKIKLKTMDEVLAELT